MNRIDEIVAAADFGVATAAKRGRNPRFPYVPVIRTGDRTAQILGVAYATRYEAIMAAERSIVRSRQKLAEDLRRPNYRALREQYGLPRELSEVRS